MKSQLKAGAILSYVVLFLQNIVGLIYTPFMLRIMGKSEYGLYSIAASVVAYLTILDLGFGNAIVRYTAKYRAEGKVEEQYKMFGMFFILYCIIGVIALGAGCILYFNAENIFDTAMTANEMYRTKIILALMVVNLAVTFPFSLFDSIITAYEQFVFQKIVVITRIILNTATMVVLLNFGYKAVAMVIVVTIFNFITLGTNFWYCKHFLKIKIKFGSFQWSFLKEVSIYSLWIFMNAIMDRIYWSTGQFVLGALVGTAAVAVFAIAIQLENMYMAFSTAISGVFLPKVTTMAVNETDKKVISDLFIKTGRIQYCIMSLILSGFILFGRQFIALWAGDGYSDAYIIALLFFIPLTVPLIQNLGITILQARNQMKFRSLLYLGISLISLVAQIPLAKYFGGIGCACAIAGALVLGQIIIMNIYYQVRQNIDIICFWIEIGKMSLIPLALTTGFYFALQHYSINSWASLTIGIVVYMVIYMPLFYIFSMNHYERDLITKPLKKFLKRA